MGLVTLSDAIAILASTLVTISIQIWAGGSKALLVGVRAYFVPSGGTAAAPGGAKPTEKVAKAQERLTRRQRREADTDTSSLNGAEQLMTVQLDTKYLGGLERFQDFDNLAFMSLLALVAFAMSEGVAFTTGLPRSKVAMLLPVVAACLAVTTLAKFEFTGPHASPNDAGYALGIACIALMASFAMLYAAPPGWLDFSTGPGLAAAQALAQRAVASAAARTKLDVQPGVIEFDATIYKMLLALLSCFIAAVLFPAAARTTRSFWTATHPPPYCRQYIEMPAGTRALMAADFCLPLAAAALWVQPLSLGLFGLSQPAVEVLKALLLLHWGVLRLLLFQSYVQAYCDRAMVGWYQVKHGGAKLSSELAERIIRTLVANNNLLLLRAATQTLAPAVLALAYGALLAGRQLLLLQQALAPPAAVPPAAALGVDAMSPQTAALGGVPSVELAGQCLAAACQWLGFWLCGSWFASSAFVLALVRIGAMKAS